jgi:ATP-binding cassette subfamily G (WHITE) protein 2 (SNQ2)
MARPSSARKFDILFVYYNVFTNVYLYRIHQPSAELFQMFDRLLLLKKGGQTVYFGDVGRGSSTMLEYFESNGAPLCGPDANP